MMKVLSDAHALRHTIALVLLLAALIVVPVVVNDGFVYHIFITICLFAALSTAWNIVGGFAGQLSLGHAIFYGIGAYTGVMLVNSGISTWFAMPLGAVISAVVAVIISYPCFRLRGPFFALATVAFLKVFAVLALHFRGFTGGATGMMVPLKIGWSTMIFRERMPSLVIAYGLMLLCLAVAWWIRSHRLGFYLIATRERESAARAAGVETVKIRLIAVMISAALTAMVGTFHAMYLTFIEPESVFSLAMSIQIAMFALIGGLGTVFGPLLGAVALVLVAEVTRGWLGSQSVGLHGLVYGSILMLAVLFMPNGLIAFFKPRTKANTKTDVVEVAQEAVTARTVERPPVCDDILRVERLQKRFDGLHVTNDVSFTLKEGEILGLIGPNGAGKTTVFNMISGFLKPDSGSVTVRGVEGQWHSPSSPIGFARTGVGRTFQIVQPFAAMTVEENIMVGAFHRHADVGDARDAARQTAERMGLAPYLQTEARSLTIGGLKRLEVARVMAMEPRILLLDEVMAGINQTDVRRAIDLMLSIRDSGVSIIAIEHVMQAVMSLSDRVIVINSGRIIAQGQPRHVVRDPTVVEAYLGKEFVDAAAE